MLPKKNRLPREIFEDLLKHGKSVPGSFLQAKFVFLPNNPENKGQDSRFSFVTPKAVSKLAIKRNLLRRRGYSCLSKITKDLKKPIFCAFFFKKRTPLPSSAEIDMEIRKILSNIGVL